jgi:hypothetical protein
MVVERKITKKYYFITFILTTLVFATSFLIGWQVNSISYTESAEQLSNIRTELLRYDLQYKLLGEFPCEYIKESALSEEYEEVRARISKLERDKGKDNEEVLTLKVYYSVLQISDMLYYQSINQECGLDYDVVLYFYSNERDKCPSCERQGFVLDYLFSKYPETRVYSFDVDLDAPEIQILKGKYEIHDVPTIIINDFSIPGFSESDELESYFGVHTVNEEVPGPIFEGKRSNKLPISFWEEMDELDRQVWKDNFA